jgi:hypothetical protein
MRCDNKDRFKPKIQFDFCVLENCSSCNSEFFVARFLSAFVTTIRNVNLSGIPTMRTRRGISPTLLSQQSFAVFFIGVVTDKLGFTFECGFHGVDIMR